MIVTTALAAQAEATMTVAATSARLILGALMIVLMVDDQTTGVHTELETVTRAPRTASA